MAIKSAQYEITDEPQPVNEKDNDGSELLITVDKDVYIGGPELTTENGYLLEKSECPLRIPVSPGERVYVMRATGASTICYRFSTYSG